MTHTDRCTTPVASGPFAIQKLQLLIRCISRFSREKRALKKLDDRLLKDIGIGCAERDAILKHFWAAPDHWTR